MSVEDQGGGSRPTTAQERYLARGAAQPGGKLPLFDEQGRRIDRKTVESCIERGWAEPWFTNPLKPDWLVCKLTPAGREAATLETGVSHSRLSET